jgi:hypothetical protein
MYFLMDWRDEPDRSLSSVMAWMIMTLNVGWLCLAPGFLGSADMIEDGSEVEVGDEW